jgi:uroporphyrinogen-III synthase
VRTQPALWRLSYASEFPLVKPANDPPLVPHDQDQQLIVETQAVISDRPQLVLITTGYGMRRWVEVADAAGLGHELLAVLESARILARESKALGAVRAAGLEGATASDRDTTTSLINKIIDEGLVGRRVALQQHTAIPTMPCSRRSVK